MFDSFHLSYSLSSYHFCNKCRNGNFQQCKTLLNLWINMTKGHSYHLSIIKNIVSSSIVAGDGRKIMDLTGGEAVSLGLHPSVITFMRTFQFFLRFFFSCGPFLKSILNLLQYCYCFMFWSFWPWGTWHLSSLTRDQTHNPCTGRQSLNHWTTREVPVGLCFYCTSFSFFLLSSFPLLIALCIFCVP